MKQEYPPKSEGGTLAGKMNVLMIHPHDLFDKSEPWTVRIKSIAEEFARSGHEVKLCYFPLALRGRHDRAKLGPIDLIPLDRKPSLPAFFRNTSTLLALAGWADVVHFQKCHHYAAIPAVIAAYVKGKPLHYDWDDWEEKIWYESCGRGLHSRFIGISFKVLERVLPVLSDSVSCASEHLRQLTSRFGVKEEFIFDAPVGADLDKFRPDIDGAPIRKKYGISGDEQLVLYIGQLHGAQYADLFIKAANIVSLRCAHVKFMIVGEGFMEWKLRQTTHELGLGEKLIFSGSIAHDEMPFYIAAATICVAPFEDTLVTRCKSPLKIVEYMASGKTIVASQVGDVTRMLGGVGILTPAGDFHAIAKAILLALGNQDLRRNLEGASRRRAELKYNWVQTAAAVLAAYARATQP